MTLVQILVDNPNSWFVPYARELVRLIEETGIQARLHHRHDEVVKGDVLCLLSCEKIFRHLELNRYNLVVHESALPAGKGWSPLTWQILEGTNEIPITLFEASAAVDAGEIYLQDTLRFEGHELLPEIKQAQGRKTQEMILEFLRQYPNVVSRPQEGTESYYPRRRPVDSRLAPKGSIASQFDLLRVCDNERYPAYFDYRGHRYLLKIEKLEE
jgi:methionyl-tRNA formyltransferase